MATLLCFCTRTGPSEKEPADAHFIKSILFSRILFDNPINLLNILQALVSHVRRALSMLLHPISENMAAF
jgi:hypothetical protein